MSPDEEELNHRFTDEEAKRTWLEAVYRIAAESVEGRLGPLVFWTVEPVSTLDNLETYERFRE